jgi:hypothetical protein
MGRGREREDEGWRGRRGEREGLSVRRGRVDYGRDGFGNSNSGRHGRDFGRDSGRDIGRDIGRESGRDSGRDKVGRDSGRDNVGRDSGRDAGRRELPRNRNGDVSRGGRARSVERQKDAAVAPVGKEDQQPKRPDVGMIHESRRQLLSLRDGEGGRRDENSSSSSRYHPYSSDRNGRRR